jgi:hypothetical protein
MPYHVGEKGSYGCSGFPAVKDDGTVMGCHKTAEAAANQIYAINQSEGNIEAGIGIKDPMAWPSSQAKTDGAMGQPYPASTKPSVFRKPKKKPRASYGGPGGDSAGAVATTGGGTGMGTKAEGDSNDVETRNNISREIGKEGQIEEGNFVMGETTEGMVHGVVEHIMWEGGTLGTQGSEYAMESMPPENPAMSVRIYEEDMEENWVPTAYSIGMMYVDAMVVDMEEHSMSDDEEMEYMSKAETYSPNAGMKSAAARAIKWKEDGKATGAGTAVGWGRARDIVAGRSMSLSVVKRMYSFFSRHEVDKKGKDFYNTSNPSNGRIMWDAWGGDAGFSWSRAIVKRNEDKAMFADFGKDYTKATRLSEVFKADSVSVGQMVSWNSSGGRASGKVRRVITSGSYDVPGTDVTVSGTKEDPAAVITLYRNGEATDTTVAHRVSSLRAS